MNKIKTILVLMLLIATLTNCKTRKVNKTHEETQTHQTNDSIQDQKTQDQKTEFNDTSKQVIQKEGVKITFDDTCSGNMNPVTVSKDSNGVLHINPGGRKLKGVETTNLKDEKKTNQTFKFKDSTGSDKKYFHNVKDSTNVTDIKGKEVKGFNWGFLWWLLLLIPIYLIYKRYFK